jgi:exodeoxyribonuclease V beta subunit
MRIPPLPGGPDRWDTFDITGPLPTGTTLLEASAGTGKTWTIGALVTRYVAEAGIPLEQLLVVTFGRAASQELRERVREQLVAAEAALADPAAALAGGPDELVRLLIDADEGELDRRHRRIRAALASYDAATIATTHQFCSMVLDSLGVAGDSERRSRLVEDLTDLTEEVVDDLYLRAFAYRDDQPIFDRATAGRIAHEVVRDPQSRIEPAHADPATPAGRRVAFAEEVRAELDRRKRRLGILSYDDLLSQLATALEDADSPARTRMRGRWRIVLVDEFQDTDPVQWSVLERAFGGHATMVLIGDPKQAIYAFRGGDVTTYLQAAATAGTRQTLGVNWRSDAPLLRSLQVLLEGAELGEEDIVVLPVDSRAEPAIERGRLSGAPSPAPLRLRALRRAELGKRGRSALSIKDVRPRVAEDLARDVRRLLAAGAQFDGRPLTPGDIAVIAFTNRDLTAARDALRVEGVPAVIAGGGSVFDTPAAVEWLTLLEAVERPQSVPRVRAAALTCLLGRTATELDAGGDELTDEVSSRLRDWAEIFAQRGVAALMESASADGLAARVLARVGGERTLTDLRHVGEALHEIALRDRLGVVALTAWLRGQIADARNGLATERTRRLDSDAAAVQLVTIHASKGLEYPVVYLPSLADRFVREAEMPLFHDDAGVRCRFVGGKGGEGYAAAAARAAAEDEGESLRLLYVAMTRAQSQVVAWWSPSTNAVASPLHRLLCGRGRGEATTPSTIPHLTDEEAVEILTRWRDAGGPSPEVAVPADRGPDPVLPAVPELAVRTFDRTIDVDWRRTSYSSLTSQAEHLPAVGSEPEDPPRDDEDLLAVDDATSGVDVLVDAAAVVSPMARMPVGATFGSLVHAVLEHADLQAADLHAELVQRVGEQLGQWPVQVEVEALASAVEAVCHTDLGPLAGGRTLREIAAGDRFEELEFELPLAGGDARTAPGAGPRLGDLGPLLQTWLPEDDPVRPYAERLRQPALGGQSLRGYLTGFIDLTTRIDGRYFVADYKTNWLGSGSPVDPDFVLTAADYAPPALRAAMNHSDYPLQALLYSLVLHRYLRWRLPDYDPERHLGGVLYLYLRGMCGPETPVVDGQPCGVFSWRPPVGLVEAVSDLIDGGDPA